jgi:hypothetical protein
VGDEVEIIETVWLETLGKTAKVTKVDTDRAVKLDDGHYYYFNYIRPVAQSQFKGTYAERQKQWAKLHGLKVGSKVKVVRKFKGNEDGFLSADWNYTSTKAEMQGTVQRIESFAGGGHGWVRLNSSDFPYFALEPVTA